MFKKKLIQGTVLLTGASLLTRILGLANRMVLSRLIGAEGLGLLQMAIPYYSLMVVVANLCMPGAMSRVISELHARGDGAGVEQVRQLSLYLVLITSLTSALLLWSAAPLIARNFLPDARVEILLKALAPALLFVGISSVLKGYFQGMNNMLPSSLAQATEQAARVGTGLAGAYLMLPYGITAAAAGSMIGVSIGEFCGFFIMRQFDIRRQLPRSRFTRCGNRDTLAEIFRFAIPLIMIRFTTSFSTSIEAFLIPSRLISAGFNPNQATALFGELTGMALPLLFLPTVTIMPLSVTLVPNVAAAVAVHDRRRVYRLLSFSLWLTLLVGGMTSLVLYLFPVQLCQLFYSAPATAPLVVVLAPAAPFAFVQFAGVAALNGLGFPRQAFYTELITCSTLLGFIYLLTGRPELGIRGAVLSYDIAFVAGAFVCILFIYKAMRKV